MVLPVIELTAILLKTMSGNAFFVPSGGAQNYSFQPSFAVSEPEFDMSDAERTVLGYNSSTDLYEANDYSFQAFNVTPEGCYRGRGMAVEIRGGTLRNANDEDWFCFDAMGDSAVMISLSFVGGTSSSAATVEIWSMATERIEYDRDVHTKRLKVAEFDYSSQSDAKFSGTLKARRYHVKVQGKGASPSNLGYVLKISAFYQKRPDYDINYLRYFKNAGGVFWEADYFPWMTYDATIMSEYMQWTEGGGLQEAREQKDSLPEDLFARSEGEPILTSYYVIWDPHLKVQLVDALNTIIAELRNESAKYSRANQIITGVQEGVSGLVKLVCSLFAGTSLIGEIAMLVPSWIASALKGMIATRIDSLNNTIDYLEHARDYFDASRNMPNDFELPENDTARIFFPLYFVMNGGKADYTRTTDAIFQGNPDDSLVFEPDCLPPIIDGALSPGNAYVLERLGPDGKSEIVPAELAPDVLTFPEERIQPLTIGSIQKFFLKEKYDYQIFSFEAPASDLYTFYVNEDCSFKSDAFRELTGDYEVDYGKPGDFYLTTDYRYMDGAASSDGITLQLKRGEKAYIRVTLEEAPTTTSFDLRSLRPATHAGNDHVYEYRYTFDKFVFATHRSECVRGSFVDEAHYFIPSLGACRYCGRTALPGEI